MTSEAVGCVCSVAGGDVGAGVGWTTCPLQPVMTNARITRGTVIREINVFTEGSFLSPDSMLQNISLDQDDALRFADPRAHLSQLVEIGVGIIV
jgi:hypothetical protein